MLTRTRLRVPRLVAALSTVDRLRCCAGTVIVPQVDGIKDLCARGTPPPCDMWARWHTDTVSDGMAWHCRTPLQRLTRARHADEQDE